VTVWSSCTAQILLTFHETGVPVFSARMPVISSIYKFHFLLRKLKIVYTICISMYNVW